MDNNKKMEELDNISLMKIIYNEIIAIKETISNKNENKIDKIINSVDKIEIDIEEIKATLDEHGKKLDEHSKKLDKHDEKFDILETKIDKISRNLDDLSRTEKLHFEYTNNKFNRLEQKIDTNFKYLDEKIETTKNKLVSEMTDVLESFSVAATKTMKNIESKIENEKNERTLEIDQIKGINDYNKIILRNLESRICILEEESEKYNLN